MQCEYQEKDGKGRWLEKSCKGVGDRRAVDAAGPMQNKAWVGYFCGEHALAVVARTEPRTVIQCPSCGCKIGVRE